MLTGAWSDSAVASVNSFPGAKVYFFILSPPSDCLRKSKCKGRDEGGVFILESLWHFLWADFIIIYFVSRTTGLSRARIKVSPLHPVKKESHLLSLLITPLMTLVVRTMTNWHFGTLPSFKQTLWSSSIEDAQGRVGGRFETLSDPLSLSILYWDPCRHLWRILTDCSLLWE